MLNVIEVKPLGGDARRNHHVFGARFEGLDRVLALFLAWNNAGECKVGEKASECELFEPWIATASTPFNNKYS